MIDIWIKKIHNKIIGNYFYLFYFIYFKEKIMTDEKLDGKETETEVVVCDMPNPEPKNAGFIKVEAKKNGKVASIYYNFGKDLKDTVTLFGKEVTFSQARAQMKIKLQAAMRSYLIADKDPANLVTVYKPGVALERTPQDMGKATENYFEALTEAEQDAMIKRLMAAKEGK